ncbi:GM19488 [Drosophila sechellia]|uniref:GM19488 n=1 Tax=Drosophila sechellia TaxID=7238 RepID=B4I952_DROSE|nr:GM19488 [Drosophila sechellia]
MGKNSYCSRVHYQQQGETSGTFGSANITQSDSGPSNHLQLDTRERWLALLRYYTVEMHFLGYKIYYLVTYSPQALLTRSQMGGGNRGCFGHGNFPQSRVP